ncbi:MAG TPA: hypothetical protein VGK10_18510 [Prolixibacteraceae bacterium]|jgi:hypothetical protein
MAIVTDGIGKYLSGSIEGQVFVKGKFRTYLRSMPRERKASEWSEKQRQQRKGFKSVIEYAGQQKWKVIVPIWNKAALDINMSGFNLFVKANRAAFDSDGQLENPGLLHFSTGQLALPYRLWAEADAQNPRSISVSWIDQLAGSQSGDDSLMAVLYNGEAGEVVQTGFTRKDGRASIENPSLGKGEVYLFLFFWNKRLDSYSPDQVFTIKHTEP